MSKDSDAAKEKEILKLAVDMVKGKSPEAIATVINLIKSSTLLLPADLNKLLQDANRAKESANAEEKAKLGEVKALEAARASSEEAQAKWDKYVNKTYEEFKSANNSLASQHATESKLLDDILKEPKSKNKISLEAIENLHAYVNAYDEKAEKAEQENWRKLAEAQRVANIERAWHGAEKQKIETEATKVGINLHDDKQNLTAPLAVKKNNLRKNGTSMIALLMRRITF